VAAVGDDLDDVARQQVARAVGAVQHRAAREVAAAADQRQAVAQVEHLAVPMVDRRVRSHDPFRVGGVEVDRAAEALGPIDHRRVVVRVRDGDRRQASALLDLLRGGVVEQRDAVPQQVGVAEGDEQRALADREVRRRPDADEIALSTDIVRAVGAQLRHRRPLLPARQDVLAGVGADGGRTRAARRRRGTACRRRRRYGDPSAADYVRDDRRRVDAAPDRDAPAPRDVRLVAALDGRARGRGRAAADRRHAGGHGRRRHRLRAAQRVARAEGVLVSNDEVAGWVAAHPDRFAGLAAVDLARPMEAVRELRRCVADLGSRACASSPGSGRRPRPTAATTRCSRPAWSSACRSARRSGTRGPLRPSETGRPIPYIDQVAIDFPELVIVAGHIGYPWTEEMVAVARKHERVFIDTSAYTVRRYPPELVRYLRSRGGRRKVLFGTNYPMILPGAGAGRARGPRPRRRDARPVPRGQRPARVRPARLRPMSTAGDAPGSPALLCYDGSDAARRAIERAGRVLGGGPATVLTVWESVGSAFPAPPAAHGARAAS
jgi:hypothetical protein